MTPLFGLNRWRLLATSIASAWLCLSGGFQIHAATPSVEQALKLAPTQKDVDYDRPTAEEAARCTIKAEKRKGQTGWVVRDGDGRTLREFVDTNGDNIVDRWSYFKDGVEVFRDIDPKFNGKASEHRWLNTAGTRWGVSKAGETRIEYWKAISPEEVSSEVVMALRDRDAVRFNRLLLTPAELQALGLNAAKTKEIADKLAAAPAAFAELAERQNVVTATTNWIHFGGNRPGIVPAGAFGATTDLEVYENVVAVIETEGKDAQIQIGALIRVGDCWRLISVPGLPEGTKLAESPASLFFVGAGPRLPNDEQPVAGGPDNKAQKVMEELQKFDDAIAKADKPEEQARLNDKRADYFEQSIGQLSGKDRSQWIRQMADTIGAAVQSGTYPKGAERLKALGGKLEKNPDDADLAAYVEFRQLSADYALALQVANPDFAKIQTAWLLSLEQFVGRHPKTPDAADAMLQLGIAQEFAGQDDKAKQWYRQIATNFPASTAAKKAAGAATRLESVGHPIQLAGVSSTGEQIDLADYKGKTVLIHYWATWCEPCKVDMASLRELQAKYADRGFVVIGVNLDTTRATFDDFLTKNRLPWPQLYEPGGLDSRYANELGILTLPTMILIGDTGRVLNRGIHISELDNQLKSRLTK